MPSCWSSRTSSSRSRWRTRSTCCRPDSSCSAAPRPPLRARRRSSTSISDYRPRAHVEPEEEIAMATHTLRPTPATVHWGYLDAKIPPRLTVNSGDTVTIDTVSGGLADVGDTSIMLPHHREICEKIKLSPGPPILTGLIAVRGEEPGDPQAVR